MRVYLETSFFSEYYTIRTSEIARGRRATSRQWWDLYASRFDLAISNEVLRELSSPLFPDAVRAPAFELARPLLRLDLTDEVIALASLLVAECVMPTPSVEGDAVHFAAAVVHRMDFLLTWNQKHLANPNKRLHLHVVCSRLGYNVPEVVTPDLLTLESEP